MTERALLARTKRRWTGLRESATQKIMGPTLTLCLLGLAQTGFAQTLSQTEAQKLLASDAPANSSVGAAPVFGSGSKDLNTQFGFSVAISGDRALIGSHRFNDPESDSGAAYLYERDGSGMWVEVAKLSPSTPREGGEFGYSVALSGDRAIVSSLRDSFNAPDRRFVGAVYVFERNATGTWVDVAKLTASDNPLGALFGTSISLSGDRVLVGANGDRVAGNFSGSAYVYERLDTGTWFEAAKLTASDATARDFFGTSVSLSGNLALIGAYKENSGDLSDSGSAYMFERDGLGTWTEVTKLTASDARANDQFGIAVSLSDDRALIGAYRDWDFFSGSRSGSAYVFERDGTQTWVEAAKLTASDAENLDSFGISVSLSGDRALIGASTDANIAQGLNRDDSGSAYLFELDATGEWVEAAKYTASDALPVDNLGTSVSLSGDNVLIGAPIDLIRSRYPGYAYVFDILSAGGDLDQDGVVNSVDNCPSDANTNQRNFDADELGNVCDPDGDNDGVANTSDPFPLNPNLPGESGLAPLVIDSPDSNMYGFRFNGVSNNREFVERQFDASGSDLTLTLTGFDIDTRQEVRVLVNGTEVGFLAQTHQRGTRITNDNGRAPTRLNIDQSLLSRTGNTLRFEQSNPGWIWGVTDLLLSEGG